MHRFNRALTVSLAILILTVETPAQTDTNPAATETQAEGEAVLWRDPTDITSRDLYYGPGGKAHEPRGRFTFEKEDMQGSSPKFDVIDQDGVRWRVKMGDEARPETVASRFVWAAGYFANEDYFMPVLHVQNMSHLKRGANMVSPDGSVRNVRLKRHLKEKKIGTWSWAKNPFTGTREWYGLRVLMAIINNWDLKDSNNSVYQGRGDRPERHFVVSDLGASFGSPGLDWTTKGNLKAYSHSKMIGKVSAQFIDFHVPSRPKVYTFFDIPEMTRLNLCWIGHHIPRADAIWMGHLLAQLTPEQVRDAFRAAGYSSEQVEAYSRVLEKRIAELEKL